MRAYDSLESVFARLAGIEDALGILHWDTEAMMPNGAAHCRSQAIATLRGMAHDLLCDAKISDLLVEAEREKATFNRWEESNLREMRRIYAQEVAVSRDLLEANSEAVLEATIAWREARENSEFELLEAPLARVVDFQRAIGEARGQGSGLAAYDALLDGFNPGLRRDSIDPIFTQLKAALPVLIEQAVATQIHLPAVQPLPGPFPVQIQRKLGEELLRTIGYDFARGRIDSSQQPFCGGAADDVRITANYNEDNFLSSLQALFHESGHALYEQGRPREYLRQPVGKARGLTLHESQALLMELQACSTHEFVSYMAPLARAAFGGNGPAWSDENIYHTITKVEPSLIRMDADEVTYVLHAIIRYDLEESMISGDLPVADLPGAYNDAIRSTLDIDVPNDRMGCLQDIHWSAGLWGYFPSYVLGAIAAAQLFDAACKARPDTLNALSEGNFAPLRDWLRTNIHSKGCLLQTDELIVTATGRALTAGPYLSYLRARYTESS
jgi:carboxypeptidase Taq